jgi:hypothetical protein
MVIFGKAFDVRAREFFKITTSVKTAKGLAIFRQYLSYLIHMDGRPVQSHLFAKNSYKLLQMARKKPCFTGY